MELGWFELSLVVKDLEASISFYENLGFQVAERHEGGGPGASATVQKEDCRIGLFQNVLNPVETQLIFYQGDVPAIVNDLAAKGIQPARELRADADSASVFFRDPDAQLLFFINQRDSTRGEATGAGPQLGFFEVSLPVKDIRASLDFYRQLGFGVADQEMARGFVTIQNGDCRMTLYQDHLDPPRLQLIFWQGDIEAIVRDLQAKGMRFGFVRGDDEQGRSAMLFDPDGNPIAFFNLPHVVKLQVA